MYGCTVATVAFVAGRSECTHVRAHAEVSVCNNSHCAPCRQRLLTCSRSSSSDGGRLCPEPALVGASGCDCHWEVVDPREQEWGQLIMCSAKLL